MTGPFEQICGAIDALLLAKPRVVIGIDGQSAAGKSRLGERLRQTYDCSLIHMDDFFLPPEKRAPERLAEIGGNIDYERFLSEVLAPLREGKSFMYRAFDCHTLRYREAEPVPPKPLTVVEGVYSLHPRFGRAYDLTVFLHLDPDTQRQRLAARNPALLERFLREWIPLENRYFEALGLKGACDISADTSGFSALENQGVFL